MDCFQKLRRFKRQVKTFIRRHSLFASYVALATSLALIIFVSKFSENPLPTIYQDRINYANPNYGAEITCGTNTTPMSLGYYHIFGFKTSELVSNPRLAIEPGIDVSQGFCFKGSKATLIIKLSRRVILSTVMVEHIDERLTKGSGTSMPKDFKVYVSSDNENFKVLGTFRFDKSGLTQEFNFKSEYLTTYLKVEIDSNWGTETHTCLYGLRVFGIPVTSY